MTKEAFAEYVRKAFEKLPAEAQDLAARRALKREVFAWDLLTLEQLDSLCGATVAARLIFEEG